ncbi:hypothetical protein [Bradyrhizobium prioriisuperbiae]|uniref:hypothetical protein n=1 Tax=Bradyrhizobium prioriisuperbiae TaxID=2854389 RepID=UPI0028E885D8|nr:hypothetical protein [Bradyrhizobium prioritasuperba]
MSISDAHNTDFDRWIAGEFTSSGEFTALVILVAIGESKVTPLCSTYFNVIGAEIDWAGITVLFAGSGHDWNGASFFPVRGPTGGLLDDPSARAHLRELEAGLDDDRLVLNHGQFFDLWGRQLKIEEIQQLQ